jgi:hypothetical protein
MAFKMRGFSAFTKTEGNGDPQKVKVASISEDGTRFTSTDDRNYATKGYDGDIAVGDSVAVKGSSIDVKWLEDKMAMSEGPIKPKVGPTTPGPR